MTKDEIISEYKRVKVLLGHQPSKTEFFTHSKINEYRLGKIFGKNAFSKLIEDCGDTPNVFSRPKSDLTQIFEQYGELIRKIGMLPIIAERDNAKLKPTVSGILRSHKISRKEMPLKFLEFAQEKPEWQDVIALIPNNNHINENVEDRISDECYVYLMLDTRTMFHKIGISKTAEYREKTLQSEQPSIKLLAKKRFVNRRMAASFEKALHETYSHKRKRGEWFLLDEGDIKELKETLDN